MLTRPVIIAVLLSLTGCGVPAGDSLAPLNTTQKEATGAAWAGTAEQNGIAPSCIGATLTECGTRIEWVVGRRRGSLSWSIPRQRIDVNGRPIVAESPSIAAQVKQTGEYLRISAELNSNERIKGLIIRMPESPIGIGGATKDDYSRTGVYEAFAIAGNGECAAQGRLTLFQYVQNRVKPQVVRGPREYSTTSMHPTDFSYYSYTPTLHYCGRTFKIQQLIMSSIESVTMENPMGMSYSNWIYIQ
jgi:hypothetical protein